MRYAAVYKLDDELLGQAGSVNAPLGSVGVWDGPLGGDKIAETSGKRAISCPQRTSGA
jgi:hypothetical protein